MLKRTCILFLCLLGFFYCIFAQTNGILPLTGIQYFNEGICAKYTAVSIDGYTLISNRIPANKEFIITLQLPTGLTEDAAKKVYPAAEVIFLSSKKQTLFTINNMLKENEKTGFAVSSNKAINLKLSIRSEWLKNESECMIQIRYHDLKSKKQLRLLFPVSIASPTEPLAVSKLSTTIKTSGHSLGMSNALKMNNAEIMVDTSIKVAPKNAYLSIEIPNITGTTMTEVLSGKNSFWVYDKNMNEIKIADKLLKKVGGSIENNLVNYTLKIPFRLKTAAQNGYPIRFRWESTDRKKIIDIVTSK